MPRWMMNQGWSLPDQSYVHPNILPATTEVPTVIPAQDLRAGSRVRVKEFVFFGRLERRKGLWIFLDVSSFSARPLSSPFLDAIFSFVYIHFILSNNYS